VERFAPRLPNLTSLSLTWNPRITHKSLALLREHCTSIQHLQISNCSLIMSVARLVSSLPNLTVLDMSFVSRSVADDSLDAIGEFCPNIEDLDVSGAEKITPEGHAWAKSLVWTL